MIQMTVRHGMRAQHREFLARATLFFCHSPGRKAILFSRDPDEHEPGALRLGAEGLTDRLDDNETSPHQRRQPFERAWLRSTMTRA